MIATFLKKHGATVSPHIVFILFTIFLQQPILNFIQQAFYEQETNTILAYSIFGLTLLESVALNTSLVSFSITKTNRAAVLWCSHLIYSTFFVLIGVDAFFEDLTSGSVIATVLTINTLKELGLLHTMMQTEKPYKKTLSTRLSSSFLLFFAPISYTCTWLLLFHDGDKPLSLNASLSSLLTLAGAVLIFSIFYFSSQLLFYIQDGEQAKTPNEVITGSILLLGIYAIALLPLVS